MNEKVYLVFDIETTPIPYESFSTSQQEYLIRGAKTEEEIEKKKGEMALTPLTGQVITIGMKLITKLIAPPEKLNETISIVNNVRKNIDFVNPGFQKNETALNNEEDESPMEYEDIDAYDDYKIGELDEIYGKEFNRKLLQEYSIKSLALVTNPNLNEDDEPIINKTDDTTFYQTTEKKVLERFWNILDRYKGCILISFNGRNFDAPFLLLRSAILGVKPTRNIMDGTKFNYSNHIDLLDELTFYMPQAYGATRRFNFDFYTRAFGLVSPKSEGIDGSLVSVFYNEGDYQKIADYCMRDVDATWKLFLRIKNFLYSKF